MEYHSSNLATVAVAVTLQKTTVDGDAKPGAYLRTLGAPASYSYRAPCSPCRLPMPGPQ
jgi:hypothetical protein